MYDGSSPITHAFHLTISLNSKNKFYKVAGLIPNEVIIFFNLPNPSSRNVALRSTQPLTEISTRIIPGAKWRPVRKVDLTAICEPII
jgi:hypothetical protein